MPTTLPVEVTGLRGNKTVEFGGEIPDDATAQYPDEADHEDPLNAFIQDVAQDLASQLGKDLRVVPSGVEVGEITIREDGSWSLSTDYDPMGGLSPDSGGDSGQATLGSSSTSSDDDDGGGGAERSTARERRDTDPRQQRDDEQMNLFDAGATQRLDEFEDAGDDGTTGDDAQDSPTNAGDSTRNMGATANTGPADPDEVPIGSVGTTTAYILRTVNGWTASRSGSTTTYTSDDFPGHEIRIALNKQGQHGRRPEFSVSYATDESSPHSVESERIKFGTYEDESLQDAAAEVLDLVESWTSNPPVDDAPRGIEETQTGMAKIQEAAETSGDDFTPPDHIGPLRKIRAESDGITSRIVYKGQERPSFAPENKTAYIYYVIEVAVGNDYTLEKFVGRPSDGNRVWDKYQEHEIGTFGTVKGAVKAIHRREAPKGEKLESGASTTDDGGESAGDGPDMDTAAGEVIVGSARLEVPRPWDGWGVVVFRNRHQPNEPEEGVMAAYLSPNGRTALVVEGTTVSNKWQMEVYHHLDGRLTPASDFEKIKDADHRATLTHGNVVDASASRIFEKNAVTADEARRLARGEGGSGNR